MGRFFEVVKDEYRKNSGDIKLPTRSSEHSAGYDFYSPINITIPPHKMVMIWSDIKAHMYYDNVLLINVRSSMGKQPIMISNTQGWIDQDYYGNENNDGNIGFRLLNLGDTPYEIKVGDRIGQGIFVRYGIVDNDNTTTKRKGGFGSSGV